MKKIFLLSVLLLFAAYNSSFSQYYYNRALSLTGATGTYAATDPGTQLDITGSFTLECWVNQAVTTGAQIVIQKRQGSTSTGYTMYLSSGKVCVRTNSSTRLTGATIIPLGIWTHIAGTYNSSTNVFTVYVNGVADGTVTTSGAAPVTNTDSLRFGSGFNVPFNGLMDEIRVWNVERTQSDIQATMRVPLGEAGASGPYAGLVGSWRFNSVTGGSGLDEINGNNAHLTGAASYADLTNKPNPHLAFNTGLMCTGAATGTCVSIPNAPGLNPPTAMTLECWVWHNNASVQAIFGKGSSNYPYRVVKSSSNSFRVFINGTAPGSGNYGGIIPNSKWTHLAFTYNSTTGAYAYYMNGVQTQAGTQSITLPTTNTDPVSIGGGPGIVTFSGMIDEVKICTFAKTPEQVLKSMFVSADTTNAANTIAYNFEGTLADYAGGGPRGDFVGTLTGIRFTQVWHNTAEFPAPTDRWNAGNFANGFRVDYCDLPFGSSPTTINDSIYMPEGLTITDVNLFVSASHTFANDISVSLRNPSGSTTRIMYPGGTPDVGMHMITIFDDQADSTIGGLAPWSPRVKPTNTLNVFNGQNSLGWWRITLTDIFPASDNGTLVGWGIQFNNQTVTGINTVTEIPFRYSLYQNYPNPFNPTTCIKYDIAKDSWVKIALYDITGREVDLLVDEFRKAGSYEINLNGSDLASGVYFYRINAGSFTATKKMVLIK